MEEGVTDTQEHTQGGEGERGHERTNGAGGEWHRGAAPQEPTNQQQPEGQTIKRLSHQQPDTQPFPDNNSVSCHTVAAVSQAATGS